MIRARKRCPEIYGDPAILMPFVFYPQNIKKKYDVSLVLHHAINDFSIPNHEKINLISIITKDYESFITQILESKLIISSSLHGIILAETYGVPAVLLLHEENTTFKYEDWYYSTGRYDVVIAHTVEEALKLKPMELPNLDMMQKRLIESFPTDLWR